MEDITTFLMEGISWTQTDADELAKFLHLKILNDDLKGTKFACSPKIRELWLSFVIQSPTYVYFCKCFTKGVHLVFAQPEGSDFDLAYLRTYLLLIEPDGAYWPQPSLLQAKEPVQKKLRSKEKKITIIVNNVFIDVMQFYLDPSDKVSMLYSLVILNVPFSQAGFELSFQGKLIDNNDDQTIEEVGIESGDRIRIHYIQ